jgi:hypothetical protein
MRRSPSIVPYDVDHDTYLVLNDFGKLGRAWCEVDEKGTDRATLIRRLLEDHYSYPRETFSSISRSKNSFATSNAFTASRASPPQAAIA